MSQPGLKKRVVILLRGLEGTGLSMGEIMSKLDMQKTEASDLSSVLSKLLASGEVGCFVGDATSPMGRRKVRMYRRALEVRDEPRVVFDPLRMLGMGRY